jgi:hypothetical protein
LGSWAQAGSLASTSRHSSVSGAEPILAPDRGGRGTRCRAHQVGLRHSEVEELRKSSPGREANITVFELVDEPTRLTDGAHESVVAEQSLVPRWVARRGQPIKIEAVSSSSGQVASAWA